MPIENLISYFGPGDERKAAEEFAKTFFPEPRKVKDMTPDTNCFMLEGDGSVYQVEADTPNSAFHVTRLFFQLKV